MAPPCRQVFLLPLLPCGRLCSLLPDRRGPGLSSCCPCSPPPTATSQRLPEPTWASLSDLFSSPPPVPPLTLFCTRSIDAIPDNQKYKQLQRELSQVLTQRQMYIQPDN